MEKASIQKLTSDSLEIQRFEEQLMETIKLAGLPTNGILVSVDQRGVVFQNAGNVVSLIGTEKRLSSVYLSKFLAAIAAGLFDAALNYLWDETILELRKRVIQYDIEYFYDNAVTNEDKRKKLKGPDDITKLDDSELIQGARDIQLISELGYKHLDFIRYMRNWASAAHPNQNQITGLQIISWLETCIKEIIALPVNNIAVEIKQLLSNVKNNQLTEAGAKKITPFFLNLEQSQANNLASGFFGIYIQEDTSQQTRQNIHLLAPPLWGQVSETTKQELGIKYGKFTANNDEKRALLARQFLEIVSGVSYIPDTLKVAEIDTAIENLLNAHRGIGNFYSEPVFASELARLIGKTGAVPKEVNSKYVLCLVEVFLSNGNGIAWNAEPAYIQMINQFDTEQALTAILSFTNEYISSRLQLTLRQKKYRELLNLLRNKVSSPVVKELITEIDNFKGPLDKLSLDSRIKARIDNMKKILGS